jgi:hypothetical protein
MRTQQRAEKCFVVFGYFGTQLVHWLCLLVLCLKFKYWYYKYNLSSYHEPCVIMSHHGTVFSKNIVAVFVMSKAAPTFFALSSHSEPE